MQTERLISMANQIDDFFKFSQDEAQAKQDIVNHLRRFWTPAMREQLLQHARASGIGLHPLVKASVLEYLG